MLYDALLLQGFAGTAVLVLADPQFGGLCSGEHGAGFPDVYA